MITYRSWMHYVLIIYNKMEIMCNVFVSSSELKLTIDLFGESQNSARCCLDKLWQTATLLNVNSSCSSDWRTCCWINWQISPNSSRRETLGVCELKVTIRWRNRSSESEQRQQRRARLITGPEHHRCSHLSRLIRPQLRFKLTGDWMVIKWNVTKLGAGWRKKKSSKQAGAK